MRLLDVRTLALKWFIDDVPTYAILSHCWEEEEVILSDLSDLDEARKKKGFEKIEKSCEQAAKDGFDYIWIDTCCIDKSSSAELSEAINSMFAWYKESSKCYVYLADVDSDSKNFAQSKWFTRAWTLQELLAPSHIHRGRRTDDDVDGMDSANTGMEFFSRHWDVLGSKTNLSRTIAKITGVAKEYLEGQSLGTASVSMRMSWAAERQATRAEDIAYSLLGIFDVNMPLLYGEGKLKAFRRLQEEIMRISEDETLFAWESSDYSSESSSANVLASDPKDFIEAKHLVPYASDDPVIPYVMTHRGLRTTLPIISFKSMNDDGARVRVRDLFRPLRSPVLLWSGYDLLWAIIRCHIDHDFYHSIAIPLRHLTANVFIRVPDTNVVRIPSAKLPPWISTREIYIQNNFIPAVTNSVRRRFGFLIRSPLPQGFRVTSVSPAGYWDARDGIVQGEPDINGEWHASLQLRLPESVGLSNAQYAVFLALGCQRNSSSSSSSEEPKPWCHLDDTIWISDDASLNEFDSYVFARKPRHQVLGFRTPQGRIHGGKMEINITIERILGQRMFVVDVDYAENDANLNVPTLSVQEKKMGSAAPSNLVPVIQADGIDLNKV